MTTLASVLKNDETTPRTTAELRPAPEPIWPPQSWWDAAGVMPSMQKRYGQAQAGILGALDFWGIPSAIASRVAPDVDKTMKDIKRAHPVSAFAGEAAGTLAGFAPVRMLGDRLATKGYGTITQAAADAGTVTGLAALSDVIRSGEPLEKTLIAGASTAPAAVANRWIMPNVPANMAHRMALGFLGGSAMGLPNFFLGGDIAAPAHSGITGSMLAAAAKKNNGVPSYMPRVDEQSGKAAAAVAVPLAIPPAYLGALMFSPPNEPVRLTHPDAIAYAATKDIPIEYPTTRPLMPEETEYADIKYRAPRMADILLGGQ